ncbi:MAG: outer membrane beta-barrel family protein [Muribaculaceae bacterium]|nr:outer membrane beta-barrel family protein [Muribaculaceae bacterium]
MTLSAAAAPHNTPQKPTDNKLTETETEARHAELTEITVTARRPATVVMADRISYRPAETVAASTGSIHDALTAIAGVEIDSNGSISVNGQPGTTIYIDGRKTMLAGDALTAFLKSTPVSDIEKIELQSVTGASHAAETSTTIINLRRRITHRRGLWIVASTDMRGPKAPRAYGNLSADYQSESHRFSLTYTGMEVRNPTDLTTCRQYADATEPLTQNYSRRRRDLMHNAALAYDRTQGETWLYGASLNYTDFSRREPAVMTTNIPAIGFQKTTTNTAHFKTSTIHGGAYLRHMQRQPDSQVAATFDFFNHNNAENQYMADNLDTAISGHMKGHTYGLGVDIDLRQTLSTHWHIAAGLRWSHLGMNSEGIYTGAGSDRLGSEFGYNETITAVYAETRATYGPFTVKAGMRGEHAGQHIDFSGNESASPANSSRYRLRAFPSASISMTTPQAGTWLIAYTSRATRPRFADLDPFIHLFDDITHVGGNINLKESTAHTLQAAWSNNSWLRAEFTAMFATDEIVKYYREISDLTVYVTPENVPRHRRLTASIAASDIKLASWWHLAATASMSYSDYRFQPSTGLGPNRIFTPAAHIRNTFSLPGSIVAEVSASYRGRLAYGQAQISPQWNTSIGMRKSLLSDRLTITLYMQDILNTNHTVSSISLDGRRSTLAEKEYENMRSLGIALAFRFGAGNVSRKIERHNALEDDMKRVNL